MERKRASYLQLTTAFFSFISALGIIFTIYMFADLQTNIEQLYQKIKHEEIISEIDKFEASQRQEKNRLIIKYMLKLINGGENVKHELIEILSALYPNDANHLMENIDLTMEDQKKILNPLQKAAQEPKTEIQKWGIVVSSDRSIEGAEHEVLRAKNQNFSSRIYKKGRWFVTMIGPFNNRGKVERITKDIRDVLNETSFIIDYNNWCKQQVTRDQYVECGI